MINTTSETIPFTGPRRSLREDRPESSNPITRLFSRKQLNEESIRLEEIIDVDRDINIFSQQQAQLLNPEELYRRNTFFRQTGLFRSYQETQVSVIDGNTVSLNILSPEGNKKLKEKNYKLIHLGCFIIGVKGLIRKGSGTKVLLTLYDSRFESNMEEAIIALTEVDLNNNIGLFYCSPDFLINKNEFAKFIKLGIQVRGFESMSQGNNLLICLGFLGKCMNNTSINFKINTDPLIHLIGSKGIKLLKPMNKSSEELAGLEWNLNRFSQTNSETIVPSENYMYKDLRGNTIVRFGQYENRNQNEEDSEIDSQLERELTERDFIELELIETEDIILYPKELGLNLNPEELRQLEENCYINGQISDIDTLYYDYEKNIRIKIENEEINLPISSNEKTQNWLEHTSIASEIQEYMEEASSSVTQQHNRQYHFGNVPRQPYAYYNEDNEKRFKSKGKRQPFEKPFRLAGKKDDGIILNLSAHDPQLWPEVLEQWKNIVVADYISKDFDHSKA